MPGGSPPDRELGADGVDMSETSVDFPVTISVKSDFNAFRSRLGLAPNTPFRKSSQVTSSGVQLHGPQRAVGSGL